MTRLCGRLSIGTLFGVGLALIAAAACASPGTPPGGPPDDAPPQLVRVSPDTAETNVRPRAVTFVFDEVVSELPTGRGGGSSASSGSTGLESIVLISPRDGAPAVDWQRERFTVRPRRGFRPNTTYTVTLLPGLGDLRTPPNVRDTAIVTYFSTGPALDQGRVGGIVFDWVAGKPAGGALVEAVAADSTTYVTLADSGGRFDLGRLRPGAYLVRGIVDADNDRGLDRREAFDSVRVDSATVARADTVRRVEILAFVHDTTGPRLGTVEVRDSLTLRVAFDQPIEPTQLLGPDRFTVIARDSTRVPVAAVAPAAVFDSAEVLRRRASDDSAARARADSLRARGDSARAALPAPSVAPNDTGARRARRDTTPPPARPSRPSPSPEIVVILTTPLRPNTAYRLLARDQRSISGVARSSERSFTTPRPAPPPARPDSAARPRPDSAARPPAPAPRRPRV